MTGGVNFLRFFRFGGVGRSRRFLMGRFLMGRFLMGRFLMGRFLMGRFLMGRFLMGRFLAAFFFGVYDVIRLARDVFLRFFTGAFLPRGRLPCDRLRRFLAGDLRRFFSTLRRFFAMLLLPGFSAM
jgi:hypothetical protein